MTVKWFTEFIQLLVDLVLDITFFFFSLIMKPEFEFTDYLILLHKKSAWIFSISFYSIFKYRVSAGYLTLILVDYQLLISQSVSFLQGDTIDWRWRLFFSNEGSAVHFVHFHLHVSSWGMDKQGRDKLNQGFPQVPPFSIFAVKNK